MKLHVKRCLIRDQFRKIYLMLLEQETLYLGTSLRSASEGLKNKSQEWINKSKFVIPTEYVFNPSNTNFLFKNVSNSGYFHSAHSRFWWYGGKMYLIFCTYCEWQGVQKDHFWYIIYRHCKVLLFLFYVNAMWNFLLFSLASFLLIYIKFSSKISSFTSHSWPPSSLWPKTG